LKPLLQTARGLSAASDSVMGRANAHFQKGAAGSGGVGDKWRDARSGGRVQLLSNTGLQKREEVERVLAVYMAHTVRPHEYGLPITHVTPFCPCMQFATAQFDYDLSSLQNTNEELLHLHKLQMWFLKVFSTHTHAICMHNNNFSRYLSSPMHTQQQSKYRPTHTTIIY
jgi:hypothetical protein